LSTTLRHVLTEVSEFFHLNSLVCYPDLRRNGRCFGRLSASAHAYLRRTTVQHNSDRWKLQGPRSLPWAGYRFADCGRTGLTNRLDGTGYIFRSVRKFTDFTGAILVRGSRDGSWKTAKQKILWKSPRITLPRAILASTFIPSLRVPKIQAYTAPQGGAKRTSCQRTRIATRVAESAKRKPFECRRESRRRYTGRSKQSPSRKTGRLRAWHVTLSLSDWST